VKKPASEIIEDDGVVAANPRRASEAAAHLSSSQALVVGVEADSRAVVRSISSLVLVAKAAEEGVALRQRVRGQIRLAPGERSGANQFHTIIFRERAASEFPVGPSADVEDAI
jgi:hypothetical protein